MKEPKTKKQKTSALGRGMRWKKRRLKYIAILPSLITLMNGMCGFLAISYASRGHGVAWQWHLPWLRTGVSYFAMSGYMIFFAMIADMLDGRIARLSKTTSSFGGQLDSLCDAISFGVAPAFLTLKLVGTHLQELRLSHQLAAITGRSLLLGTIIYAMGAVIRLARFNVENKEDESAHMHFEGLPSPPAAGLVVSLVIFQQDFLPKIAERPGVFFRTVESLTIWSLPFITTLAGILMVSRIGYPHVANHLLRGKKSFPAFLLILFTALLVIWNLQLAMVIGFCGFALYGIIRQIIQAFRRKKPAAPVSDPEHVP